MSRPFSSQGTDKKGDIGKIEHSFVSLLTKEHKFEHFDENEIKGLLLPCIRLNEFNKLKFDNIFRGEWIQQIHVADSKSLLMRPS